MTTTRPTQQRGARKALEVARRAEAEQAKHGTALTALTTSVNKLTGAVDLLTRFFRWAALIVGGYAALRFAQWAIGELVTLHH